MKKNRINFTYILILCSLILFLISFAKAEDCINDDDTQPCCNGIISTDPRDDPQGNPYASNPGRSEMINHFNWMSESFNVYHPGYYGSLGNPEELTNPFFTSAEYLRYINFYQFIPIDYLENRDKLNFYPEDGWELIHKHNGYALNESDFVSTMDNRDGPYYILYNKYTGVLRFIAALRNSISSDIIQTEIKYHIPEPNPNDLKCSALFNHYKNIASPLDQETTTIGISASSSAPYDGNFWASDFKMAYDPCICHNRSLLYFKFYSIDTADLQLSGRLLGTSVPLDNSGNSPELYNRDFLTSVLTNGFDPQSGMLIYRNIDDLVEKYKTPELSIIEELGTAI